MNGKLISYVVHGASAAAVSSIGGLTALAMADSTTRAQWVVTVAGFAFGIIYGGANAAKAYFFDPEAPPKMVTESTITRAMDTALARRKVDVPPDACPELASVNPPVVDSEKTKGGTSL